MSRIVDTHEMRWARRALAGVAMLLALAAESVEAQGARRPVAEPREGAARELEDEEPEGAGQEALRAEGVPLGRFDLGDFELQLAEPEAPALETAPLETAPLETGALARAAAEGAPAQAAELDRAAIEGATPASTAGDDDVEVRAALGRGVTVDAGDAFSLTVRARIQVRAVVGRSTPDAVAAGEGDDWSFALQIRRARLQLQGHAFAPQLRYYVQLGFAPQDMEADLLVPLRDAQLVWAPLRELGIRVGQMKVPYGLERQVSSSALQLVDRSSITSELNLDRDLGIVLFSDDFLGLGGALQYQVGVFGGRGRNRFGGSDGVLVAGQLRVSPLGAFDHLAESDLAHRPEPRLSIGASAAYNVDSTRARSTHAQAFEVGSFDYLHLGADVHFKWAGFSLLSEVLFREASAPSASGEVDGKTVTVHSRSAWGWLVQAGYLLEPIPLELAVRYGELRPLEGNAAEAGLARSHEVGGGLGYYVEGRALQVQLDYFYYFGDDPAAERHQVRLQAQLYF